MEKPNTRLHDENNGLDYVLVGDYYFPALILAEDSRPVGRWGRMYKRYLKEHHSARYQALLLSGRLNSYLADIDAQAEEQLELLTQQIAEREGVNEELKAANHIYKKYVDSTNQSLEDFVTAFHDKNLDGSSSNAENQLLGYQQQQTELMKNFATVVSEAVSTSIANTMRTELVPIFDEMKSTACCLLPKRRKCC